MTKEILRQVKDIKSVRQNLIGLEKELLSRGDKPEVSLQSLPMLDRAIWGLRKGLTVIAARTSQGKSALALQIGLDTAKQGVETIILSLEMDVESMLERMFCSECKINNYELLSGAFRLNNSHQVKFEHFRKQMSELPLLLTCGIGKTFGEVNQFIEMLNPKPKVIVLDYIQMSKSSFNERTEMAEYIRQFRQLMLENNIRGIVCSQINRQIEKENDYKPRLENLKGTGALEEVADVVMLLHWNYFYTRKEEQKNDFDLFVAKNRFGATGHRKLVYHPEYYMFSEREDEEEYTKI